MVCVILCTYNAEKYLNKQLESLLQQTQKIDKVIIYDDQSTDSTVDLIRQFIIENSLRNWSLNVNSENKGWRLNFYDAIKACEFRNSNDFIFFCDQDDIWHPTKIAQMVKVLDDNPQVGRLNGQYFLIDEKDKIIKKCKQTGKLVKEKLISNIPGIRWGGNIGCTMCVRGNLLNFIDFFPRNNYFAHDLSCVLLSAYLDAGYKLDENVVYYRQHALNESKKIKTNDRLTNTYAEIANVKYYLSVFEVIDSKSEIVKILTDSLHFCERRVELIEKKSLKKGFAYYKLYKEIGKRKTFLADMKYILKNH